MKALIVDDERLARGELRRLLAAHPELRVVGEAANALEARQLIEELAPDVVFLDVQMPGGTGFDLLASLDDPPPVIFTTAFDQYAIKAFDVSALDYLLKPIDPARLAHALRKLHREPEAARDKLQPADARVFIKDGDKCWFVAMEQIVLFESEGNYTRVYFDQNRPMLLRSLNQLEARLDPEKFVRVSRRQIVNMDFVVGIAPSAAGGMVLTLKDDLKVPMSRRRAAQFKQMNGL
ncbi:LytR/AlgR family response regulator transcription factor [Pseudoduganella sp. GCM10020061]|uniref:LytR/AlgR family response regulator transcription factor n=1 Tax=Pseudoduganella sp. GCM10020061 TaxID=3317345 RepID=UPI00363611BA